MPKTSPIQFFFTHLWLMVTAFGTKAIPAMQNLRQIKTAAQPRPRIKTLVTTFCILTTLCASTLVAAASNTPTSSSKRWYRYYDDRGVPMISGSVSEQHMLHGYDVLDSTLNVLRHVPAFSTSKYEQEESQRNQAIERRIADRHVIETYVSSSRATIQRDRELSDLDAQIKRSEVQSEGLTTALNANITSAANYERQGDKVPAGLQTQLTKNRTMLSQSDSNVSALKAKREATEQQFNKDIATLKRIEQQGGGASTP